jgi:hypothetical protein
MGKLPSSQRDKKNQRHLAIQAIQSKTSPLGFAKEQ